MSNLLTNADTYTKSKVAGKRLYLAIRVKGISRTKKGLFSDDEWIGRNLPKTAKSLSAWLADGVPIYSRGKNIRPIHAIAEYFGVEHQYFTDDRNISDEKFLNKILSTPTASEQKDGASDKNPPNILWPLPSGETSVSKKDSDPPPPSYEELAASHPDLKSILENEQSRETPSGFFKSVLSKKIQSDISNFSESDFIEITSIHQIPLMWIECHEHIEKSLLITSYADVGQWVSHPTARKTFQREVELVSQGVCIKRIYIYDTPEELRTLLDLENVRLQLEGNIELKFISHSAFQNFYYIKDIIASIEVIDAGLIDENWLFLAFFDASRNPVKLKLCWDSIKVNEYRVFLNELWLRAHPPEGIRI